MEGTTPDTQETAHRASRASSASYDAASLERWAAEPDKRAGRTAFQRDRARVLHSAALRRLAGKTQVVTPGISGALHTGGRAGEPSPQALGPVRAAQVLAWDPSPRTRLTHSLECAQVGRELGAALGCDPDLVETACLSHDLGHPPFGHNGEQVLNEIARDCGGFEGNAQSLRLLTRLEPKRFVHAGAVAHPGSARWEHGAGGAPGDDDSAGPDGGELVSVGLNLTRAALDAATKYPWPRGGHPTDPASPKFGVYDDDRPVFDWIRRGAPPHRTCFEAQVMDWADDVAYSVHDLEDALHAGHVDTRALHAPPERHEICAVAIGRYVPADTDPAELAAALDRLLRQEWWPHGYDGSAVAQARLKDATSQLIGRFCLAAEEATHTRWGPRPGGRARRSTAGGAPAAGSGGLRRHGAELVVPRAARHECAVLKAVADLYVIQRADQAQLRADQRVVVAELAAALGARAPEGLDPQFRALFEAAGDDRARKRVIVDQIACLTDASARALHLRFTDGRF